MPVTVKGGVVCKVEPTLKESTTGKLLCEQSKGLQKYTSFEGAERMTVRNLELIEERNGKTLKSGEQAIANITFSTKVEVT